MEGELKIEQIETIKLMKMSKGYQWELKVIPMEAGAETEASKRLCFTDIDRLELLNKELERRFNSSLENGKSI